MFRTLLAAAACTSVCFYGIASAQEAEQFTIKVGGSVTSAVAALRKRKIEFGEGRLALRKMDDNEGDLLCVVDRHRTNIVLFYSKSTGTITSMSAITFPHERSPRIEHIWSKAKSVTLGDDGSYSIHFLPADPPISTSKLPRSVYPKSKAN